MCRDLSHPVGTQSQDQGRHLGEERRQRRVAVVGLGVDAGGRAAEPLLDTVTAQGIGFIPWFPLAAGPLAASGGPLQRIADDHHATPSQLALAWLLKRSPVMLPIPGTSSVAHLEENVAAAEIRLSDDEVDTLSNAGSAG